jgi:hypothetical protein
LNTVIFSLVSPILALRPGAALGTAGNETLRWKKPAREAGGYVHEARGPKGGAKDGMLPMAGRGTLFVDFPGQRESPCQTVPSFRL